MTQPIDTSTSAGRMMVNVLMSFGEYERLVIAERTRDKMAASKKRGIWMGGYVPYGFFVKDKKLYAHPEEAPVVRRIFQLSTLQIKEVNNLTFAKIKRALGFVIALYREGVHISYHETSKHVIYHKKLIPGKKSSEYSFFSKILPYNSFALR